VVKASDGLESVKNNYDYKYKLKNIGLGSLGAPYRSLKRQKAPKFAKGASKWQSLGITTKI
jgi:hypothetical protein